MVPYLNLPLTLTVVMSEGQNISSSPSSFHYHRRDTMFYRLFHCLQRVLASFKNNCNHRNTKAKFFKEKLINRFVIHALHYKVERNIYQIACIASISGSFSGLSFLTARAPLLSFPDSSQLFVLNSSSAHHQNLTEALAPQATLPKQNWQESQTRISSYTENSSLNNIWNVWKAKLFGTILSHQTLSINMNI